MSNQGIHRRTPIEPNIILAMRFWKCVHEQGPDECWLWNGCNRGNQYGVIKWRGKLLSAHRVAYVLRYGEVPEGKIIMHKCNNRQCVNPAHLKAGTPRQNVIDAAKDGLRNDLKGEAKPNAKLTEEAVREMRRRHSRGESMRSIAIAFGVRPSTAEDVIHRVAWKHVN